MMRRFSIAVVFAAGLSIVAGVLTVALMDGPYLAAQVASAQTTNPADAATPAQNAGKAPAYADVAAVISKYHCTVCHGGTEPRAGLSLDDHKSMLKGSKRGPVIVPGNPANSEIILRLKGQSEPRMPFTGPPWLSDEEVATIERWIAAGARE